MSHSHCTSDSERGLADRPRPPALKIAIAIPPWRCVWIERGEVNAAIVALSLSLQTKGNWILIPQELHQPLDQALAVIKGAKHEKEARQFASFINGPQGRPTMRKYGFILPGGEPVSAHE